MAHVQVRALYRNLLRVGHVYGEELKRGWDLLPLQKELPLYADTTLLSPAVLTSGRVPRTGEAPHDSANGGKRTRLLLQLRSQTSKTHAMPGTDWRSAWDRPKRATRASRKSLLYASVVDGDRVCQSIRSRFRQPISVQLGAVSQDVAGQHSDGDHPHDDPKVISDRRGEDNGAGGGGADGTRQADDASACSIAADAAGGSGDSVAALLQAGELLLDHMQHRVRVLSRLRYIPSSDTTTRNVRIQVVASHLPVASRPSESHYAFSYRVTISNIGKEDADAFTIVMRKWSVLDSNGHEDKVSGPGVVGEHPTLAPGDSFKYASGTAIRTPTGQMQGSFSIFQADSQSFEAKINPFSLLYLPASSPTSSS